MENIIIFLSAYGWKLALIALIGIVLLGALKYANAFAKIEKGKRKPIYFLFSIGFSVVAAGLYLIIAKSFTVEYFAAVVGAIYALNQTFYAIYETTTLKDLIRKIYDYIKNKKSEG